MLEIRKRGKLLITVDAHFAEDSKSIVKTKCDVCHYHDLYSLHSSKNDNSIGYSLISDLSIPKEELWSLLHKSTKYDIRRSERYNVKYETYDSQAIKDQERFDWNSFSSMYERMFSEKDLPRSIDREWFNSIIFAGGGT